MIIEVYMYTFTFTNAFLSIGFCDLWKGDSVDLPAKEIAQWSRLHLVDYGVVYGIEFSH